MSRYKPPKGISVYDYARGGPGVTLSHPQMVDRIVQLERANLRLANRVEVWQWIAIAAVLIASLAVAALLMSVTL